MDTETINALPALPVNTAVQALLVVHNAVRAITRQAMVHQVAAHVRQVNIIPVLEIRHALPALQGIIVVVVDGRDVISALPVNTAVQALLVVHNAVRAITRQAMVRQVVAHVRQVNIILVLEIRHALPALHTVSLRLALAQCQHAYAWRDMLSQEVAPLWAAPSVLLTVTRPQLGEPLASLVLQTVARLQELTPVSVMLATLNLDLVRLSHALKQELVLIHLELVSVPLVIHLNQHIPAAISLTHKERHGLMLLSHVHLMVLATW
jgi:hypothetical protein